MNTSPLVSAPVGSCYEQRIVENLLGQAGIHINGPNPWDILVNDDRFYKNVFRNGSLGLGEGYMDGLWDCGSPDTTLYKLLSANLETHMHNRPKTLLYRLYGLMINGQSLSRARKNIRMHYDLGNDLFKQMLDKQMIYSCAYWQGVQTLEQAQEKKLDLICRKLHLEKGQHVLDIGCGWGGFASYAAQKYGVNVVGITLSEEQAALAKQYCSGLPIEIRLQDYRNVEGQFDRVVSVGMMEHVGYKNYYGYMQKIQQLMKDDSLFLLHTIGSGSSVKRSDPWINRYIFPNGMIPSACQITKAAEGRLVMEDWHIFPSCYYDRTLMEWRRRFKYSWPELKARYNKTFYRMWDYYLCCSAASFRAKKNQLWQIVFSKSGNHQSYTAIR